MRTNEFLGLVETSFLEQILMLQKEDYKNPDAGICEGEVVIGQMNNLEKAAYTLFMERFNALKEFITDKSGKFKDIELLAESTFNLGEKFFLQKKLQFTEMKFYRSMLWTLIENRFSSKENLSVGVRSGFVIVRMSQNEMASDCETCPQKKLCSKVNNSNGQNFSLN